MTGRIGLITNARAGSVKHSQKGLDRIVLEHDGLVRSPRDFKELDDNVREFYEEGVEVVVTLGGDGTNHQVMTRVHNTYDGTPVAFSFLGRGTQNLMRKYLGLRDKCPKRQLEKIAQKASSRIANKRLLKITADERTHYGFLFGVGMPRAFMARYYEEEAKRFRTIKKVIWSGITGSDYTMGLFAPEMVHLVLDGKVDRPRPYTGIMVGGIRNVDSLHSPLYLADREEQNPHIISMDLGPKQLLPHYFKLLCGRPIKQAIHNQTFETCELFTTSKSPPVRYMIDGDLSSDQPYDARYIRIEKGPRVRILIA
jgi:diacylglycerol kinase family enzyme